MLYALLESIIPHCRHCVHSVYNYNYVHFRMSAKVVVWVHVTVERRRPVMVTLTGNPDVNDVIKATLEEVNLDFITLDSVEISMENGTVLKWYLNCHFQKGVHWSYNYLSMMKVCHYNCCYMHHI